MWKQILKTTLLAGSLDICAAFLSRVAIAANELCPQPVRVNNNIIHQNRRITYYL